MFPRFASFAPNERATECKQAGENSSPNMVLQRVRWLPNALIAPRDLLTHEGGGGEPGQQTEPGAVV